MKPHFIALFLTCIAANAMAQIPPEAQAQLQQALEKDPQALQKGMAVATLLGCTQKQAGKEATSALYQELQAVGKQAEGLCKTQQTAKARALVIEAFRKHQANPVVTAAHGCYGKNKPMIDALAGPKIAPEIGKYVELLKDPSQIESQVTEQTVCGKKS